MKHTSKPKRKTVCAPSHGNDRTAAEVRNAIECITTVPPGSLNVTVHQGWVRIEGKLSGWNQKDSVDNIARQVPGVKGLISLIRVE